MNSNGFFEVHVAAPVEAALLRVRVPREVEVQVADRAQDHLVAAVREAVGEVLGAAAGDVVPDVRAPAPVREAGVGDQHGPAVEARLAHRDLLPAREGNAVGPQDLLDAAVEEEPEVVDALEALLLHGREGLRATAPRRRPGPRRRPCGGCAGARPPRGGGPRGPAPPARRRRTWTAGRGSSRCRGRAAPRCTPSGPPGRSAGSASPPPRRPSRAAPGSGPPSP